MNIHFTDEKLFDTLMNACLFKTKVGSHTYGTNDKNSDEDILIVYAPCENMLNSLIFKQNIHKLQYKKDGNDYIFIDLLTFFQNIINCDNTLDFEAYCEIDFTPYPNMISQIMIYREDFINHKLMKAYIGRAKKDLNLLKTLSNKEKSKSNKLLHALRGVLSVQDMIKDNWYENKFEGDKLEALLSCKNPKIDNNFFATCYFVKSEIEICRIRINELLEQKKIEENVSSESLIEIDYLIRDFMQTEYFMKKQDYDIDLSMFADAYCNGIKY